jgi:histidine triad (HIT) family protein
MTDCLFCKIINGDIPSQKVYEDEYTFSFLDINPSSPGHTLVVPKKHFRNLYDMDEKYVSAVAKTVQKVAVAIKKAIGADALNTVSNNERAAGQVVFHAHTHVVPRFLNDGVFKKALHMEYKEGEAKDVAEKIRAELQ